MMFPMAGEPKPKTQAYAIKIDPDFDGDAKIQLLDENQELISEITLYSFAIHQMIVRLEAIKAGWVQHHSSIMVH